MNLPLNQKPLSKRPYLAGALFWIAFSLLAVLVRGVRWDENYAMAQVLLGQVPYPEGHPLNQFVHGHFSLQPYLLAGLMYVLPGPLPANLVCNWLFLAAATVPVFLLGTLFARRQLAGHVAAIFVLLEIHVAFYGPYPIEVWPGTFSSGPAGIGYMLFGLWALLDRRFRLAGFLLGLAPAVYPGQFLPLLATGVLYGLHLAISRQYRHALNLVAYAVPGLLVCVAFAMFLYEISAPPPTSGPYFTPVAPEVLWETYMERFMARGGLPYMPGHLVLAASVLVGLALLVYRRRGILGPGADDPPPPVLDAPRTWGVLYCGAVCVLVWGSMLVQYAAGPAAAHGVAGWFPYRLMSHVSPLLIPLLVAIGYDRDNRIPGYLPLLLLAPLLAPLLHLVASYEFNRRYVAPNAYVYYLLFGAAAGTAILLAYRRGRRPGNVAAGAAGLVLAALAWFYPFGAACVALGVSLPLLPAVSRIPMRAVQASSAVLACLLLVAMLGRVVERREQLPRSPFHAAVSDYLADQGDPDAMILVPYNQLGEQVKYGHPVMADTATLTHVIQRPEIAPAANAIFEDFYGISLDPEAAGAEPPRAWHEVWPAKTLGEWRALARKYGVDYVVAPDFMALPLEEVLRGHGRVLYRIR